MSKKDFILIARVIRDARLAGDANASVAIRFADALRSTNGRFDRERFLKACDA